MLSSVVIHVEAQTSKGGRKGVPRHSISSTMLSGYSQIGSTDLCCKITTNSIDIQGKFSNQYYGSTYSNGGYKVAMQVGSNSAQSMNPLDGSTANGVEFRAEVVPQSDLARVCYFVTNTNNEDVTVSLGIHADVMIGNNDRAPIIRKVDTIGNTYGLSLLDGNGAQLCVLFGTGLTGVTGVSDFWFGYYNQNNSAQAMVGNYSHGSNWMVENGNYDSGMGWCWKNRTIPAGTTVLFSWLIGVGDVNLEPNSTFEVTPADPEGWNDLSRLHVLALEGDYESPAGLAGKIEYAVEESEEWIALTETLESGSTFSGEVRAMFNPELSIHTIKFRTVDQVGNTTLLPPIVYPDVAYHALDGISEKTFTGDSLFQTDLTCDLDAEQYEIKNYQNNVNAGTASFNIEGVFPYTIGRKTYTFQIVPVPLSGNLTIVDNTFVYNGQAKTPNWSFSNSDYATLENDIDYICEWSDNVLPGTATLTVSGKGNYTGSLTQTFTIEKAPLTDDMYVVTLPDEDVCYDGLSHAATVDVSEGVGVATVTYRKDGVVQSTAPIEEGIYEVYLEFAEGSLYYGLANHKIGSFAIFKFSETEWASLQALYDLLATSNPTWAQKWQNIIHADHGITNVSSLAGVEVAEGHVVGLDLTNEGLIGPFPSMLLTFSQVKVIDVTGNNFTGDIADIVSYMRNYLQVNTTFTSELETLNVTGNSLSGNIGLLAQSNEGSASVLSHFPELITLWASGNQLNDVFPHLPATIVNLDLSKQITNKEIGVNLAEPNAGSIAAAFPRLLLYNHQEQSYNTTPYVRVANYPPTVATRDYSADKPYWGIDISFTNGTPTVTCLNGNNTYRGQSGDKLYVSYPLSSSEVIGSYCYSVFEFLPGDANFTDGVSILDLQATINYIFGDYQVNPFNFTAADTYTDNKLNVQDVVCIANIIIESEEPQSARQIIPQSNEDVYDAYLFVRDGKLMVSASTPIASFDISFDGSPDIDFNLEALGYDVITRQHSGKTRALAYTLSGQYITSGETVLAYFNGAEPVVSTITMSSPDAHSLNATFINDATYIVNMEKAKSVAKSEYYLINGTRISKPVQGINVVKTVSPDGTVSTKVINIK